MAGVVANEKQWALAKKKLGPSGKCLACNVHPYRIHDVCVHAWDPSIRKLFKALLLHAPVVEIKKEGELCAGGDIRIRKNRWLYEALESMDKKGRLCRESKLRVILGLLQYKLKLCGGPTSCKAPCCSTFAFVGEARVDILAAGPRDTQLETWIADQVSRHAYRPACSCMMLPWPCEPRPASAMTSCRG